MARHRSPIKRRGLAAVALWIWLSGYTIAIMAVSVDALLMPRAAAPIWVQPHAASAIQIGITADRGR